jgi:hypothetical protein
MTRKGTLYCLRLSTFKWIYSTDVIGVLVFLLYPFIGIGVSKCSKGVFKNSESFTIHLVFSKAKALALVSAKAVVLTLYPLRDSVQRTIKLFPPINQLKSTSDMSIPSDPEEETSFRVLLFPTLSMCLPTSHLRLPSELPPSCLCSLIGSP